MASKLVFVLLVAVAVVGSSANENVKRQSGPNFAEYFNKFQEQMKPIVGNFPNLPNGVGSGSFPSFPNFGGLTGSGSSPTKRQVTPNTIGEWIGQLGQGNNPFTGLTGGNLGGNFGGNLPFKPPNPFGQLPFGGSSGSGGSSHNE